MKNLRLLIIALTLVTFFSACKKDDAPKVKTKSEMISSDSGKQWRITSMKAKYTLNGQQREEDVMNLAFDEACERDNLTVLFRNKTYEAREGALKCGSADLLDTGTWELKNNDTELHVTTPKTGTLYSTLKEVTETSITGEFPRTFDLTSGGKVETIVTVVYTAQ